MWPLLEKISEQVTRYSTFLGQLWYICVFVFRLIVVVTIGGAVYGDEQSMFKCSTGVIGCANVCFNEFSKISHMRFWAFQLLAVAAPTVFFHFYSMYVNGQIEKLKKEEEAQRKMEEGEAAELLDPPKSIKKMSQRRKSIGRVKVRQIYVGSDLKEIPFTRKVHYAYFVTVIMRLIVEGVFIYLGYNLFRFMNPVTDDTTPLDFLWFRVPMLYYCHGEAVSDACGQHLMTRTFSGIPTGIGGYVPCWVSRPWEKTIFLRYMNILSGICFCLSAAEFVYLIARGACNRRRRPKFRSLNKHYNRQESVFYPSAPPHEGFYPSLGVPVRLSGKYPENMKTETNGYIPTKRQRSTKKVQINSDKDSIFEGDLDSTATAKSFL